MLGLASVINSSKESSYMSNDFLKVSPFFFGLDPLNDGLEFEIMMLL